MLLEEKIHDYWRDSPALCDAMPFDRFFTAPSSLPAMPCVALMMEKTDAILYTNRTPPLKRAALRFEIHNESYEKAVEMARLVEETFDRLQLHDPERAKSFLFRLISSENSPEGENAWKFMIRFQVIG